MVYNDNSDFMRLLLTTLFAGLAVFLVILTTRIWGQGQSFYDLKHPFIEGPSPFVIVKANTLTAMEDAIAQKKDVILWVDARISSDQVMYLLDKNEDQKFLDHKKKQQESSPQTFILKGGKLTHYAWEEINEFYKTTPALREVYMKFPQQKFVINVVDNTPEVNSALVKDLKDTNSENRTLIQSDTLVVMTSTKEIKPEWIYGTAQADLMRMMSFDSMWILPSTQFKGDVYVAPFSVLKRPAFNDNIIAEMKRRHKKIFLGPIATLDQLNEAKRLGADAFITADLQQLSQWLDQSQTQ